MNKKIKIIIIVIACLVITIPTSVYAYSYHSYKTDFKQAETLLSDERYDDAINAFQQLLTIRFIKPDKSIIDERVNLASTLKLSKETYVASVKLYEDKKYLEAIDCFKNVKESDIIRFSQSQERIKEASNLYITDNINKAKAEADNEKFENAITFLDTVLKFDQSNQEATNLEDAYNKAIQRIKEEAEARKKAEEDAIKKAEEAIKKTEEEAIKKTEEAKQNVEEEEVKTQEALKASQNTSTNVDSAVTENNPGYTVTANDGWFSVKYNPSVRTLDGFGIRYMDTSTQPNGIYYKFLSYSNNSVSYEITFHLPSGDKKQSGVSSGEFRLLPEWVPMGQQITIDISAIYKGKTYTTTFSRVVNTLYN